MALAEQIHDEPERQTLTFGTVSLKFSGRTLDPSSGEDADLSFHAIAAVINPPLNEVASAGLYFTIGGYYVEVDSLSLEFERAFEGSVVARFRVVGTVLISMYGLIASYPSFKEAIPILKSDITHVIEIFIRSASDGGKIPEDHITYDLFFREEDDLLSEIERNKGG